MSPYKAELIRDLPEDATISFYKQGDFTDLCAGPHLPRTGKVKAVKAYSSCGRLLARRRTRTRCFSASTAFPSRQGSELNEHLDAMEEAKKRDHNKLGRELGYFTTCDVIGQGLPIMLPNGARVIQLLQRFVEDEEQKRGWLLTKTPYMAKARAVQDLAATGITIWTACSCWATRTTETEESASPCAR